MKLCVQSVQHLTAFVSLCKSMYALFEFMLSIMCRSAHTIFITWDAEIFFVIWAKGSERKIICVDALILPYPYHLSVLPLFWILVFILVRYCIMSYSADKRTMSCSFLPISFILLCMVKKFKSHSITFKG